MLMHENAVMQLAAGAEHVIAGKTVRVNLAGPRPELPLLFMDPTQTQPMLIPQSTGKPACITSQRHELGQRCRYTQESLPCALAVTMLSSQCHYDRGYQQVPCSE